MDGDGMTFGAPFGRVFRPVFGPPIATAIGPTLLIHDAFTDTDGTLLTAHTIAPVNVPGASWSAPVYIYGSGVAMSIQSNAAAVQPISSAGVIQTIDSGTANGIVQANITTINAIGSGAAGVVYRLTNSSAYWLADIVVMTSIRILQFSGSFVVRSSESFASAPLTTYACKLTLSGNSMIFQVGSATASYSSAAGASATRHGLSMIYESVIHSGSSADDFKVYSL